MNKIYVNVRTGQTTTNYNKGILWYCNGSTVLVMKEGKVVLVLRKK